MLLADLRFSAASVRNKVYNFTDLPSILSGDMVVVLCGESGDTIQSVVHLGRVEVLFLDPHVHHLSAMGASAMPSLRPLVSTKA